MNDKELQKIIDTKNGTISVLKDTVKKWVREYNMLDACIELQNEKINAYKMSENEANEIIAELKAKIKKYAAINEQETKDYAELKAENDRLKRIIDNVKDYCILTRNEFCESHCLRKTVCEKRDCVPIRDITNIYNLTKAEEE